MYQPEALIVRKIKEIPRIFVPVLFLVFSLLLGSCQVNARAGVTLENQASIGVNSIIRLHFSREMNHEVVESHFSIEPQIDGHFTWDGETLEFIPVRTLKPGEKYTISLSSGSTDINGSVMEKNYSWQVEIRPVSLVYLSPVTGGSELWRISTDGESTLQLTFTGGNVVKFSPSRDGERIAFSVKNHSSGEDLWLVDRDGKQMAQLISCDQDVCAEPSWSPDGTRIAFSRRSTQSQPENSSRERIWIVDVDTGDTSPLFPDTSIPGNQPSWSPEGSRIAFFNPLSDQVGIVELSSGSTWYLPATTGIVGNWSSDGERMFFTAEENTGNNLAVKIYEVDVFNQQYKLSALNEIHGEREYSVPAWSPDGKSVIFGERCIYCSPTAQIWLAENDGLQLTRITMDERYTNSSYHWDPGGSMVVFQRYQLGLSDARPEIVLWDRNSGGLTIIKQDAVQPAWLP
jgi:Tol biopolymer transport system component